MNLTYNLDYDIAALILLTIEMVYVRIQYAHEKYTNRLFIMLLHSAVFLDIVDILSALLLTKYRGVFPKSVVVLVSDLYFLTNLFLFLVFYRYIGEHLGVKYEKTVGYFVRVYFPMIFMVECIIANRYANILYSAGRYGYYTYGSMIWIIYVFPVYYSCLTIAVLIRNRKSISFKKAFSVLSFIVISIISTDVLFLFPNVLILPFGYAISLTIMIMALESPDYRNLIKTTESLEVVREELEKKDAYNHALVINTSNEMCAPIVKILAQNESYPLEEMDDKQREIYDYIKSYGRLARSVINNILEFNMIGEAVLDTTPKEYSVREMVNDVCEMMTPIVKDSSNKLVSDVNLYVPDALMGSELLLKQVLINLIENSAGSTEGGSIALMVNSRQVDRTSVNLIISVEDTGMGISRDAVKKLLQFNTKGRNWWNEEFDKDYFKIQISKKLIEQMDGKLTIDSAIGKGTVFSVIIPQTIA